MRWLNFRTPCPIALNRKNGLFPGSDGSGEHWAILASLIETRKLNGIDLQAYLAGVFTRLVNGHPMRRLDELFPWAYAPLNSAQNQNAARKHRLR